MKATRIKLETISEQIEDYLEDCDNGEQIYRNKFLPIILHYIDEHFRQELGETELHALDILKGYSQQSSGGESVLRKVHERMEEIQKEIDFKDVRKRYILGTITQLLIPYTDMADEENYLPIWFPVSGILQANEPIESLFNGLLEAFSDVIDLKIISPIFQDSNNDYHLMDYSYENRQLLIRSPKNEKRDYNIDILIDFGNWLILPNSFHGLSIEKFDPEEEPEIYQLLQDKFSFSQSTNIYSIHSDKKTYYVSAIAIQIFHNTLLPLKSLFDSKKPKGGYGELVMRFF